MSEPIADEADPPIEVMAVWEPELTLHVSTNTTHHLAREAAWQRQAIPRSLLETYVRARQNWLDAQRIMKAYIQSTGQAIRP